MNDEKDDENPWDDDGGGRTLATDGPSFEMPANVPSPISAPPPPGPPRPGPSSKGRAAPPPSAPRPAAGRPLHSPVTPGAFGAFGGASGMSPLPPPVVLGDDDLAELPGSHEDGRTLAVASPVSTAPLRDDGGFGYVAEPENDRDAETMAALSRDELFGHRSAQVVVGHDAIGEDATLAIGPGQLNQLVPQHQQQQLSQQLQQPEHYAAPPPQSWPGFDPMMPQSNSYGAQNVPHGQFPPPSGQHPSMAGPQSSPMSWGPNPEAQTAYTPAGAYPHPQHSHQPQHAQQQQQQQEPPMMQPAWAPQPAPEGAPSNGIQFTPQVLLLIGVGVVCLAIFVIGVVLFATTKF